MKQLKFKGTEGWGGRRRGAGRKNRTGSPNHMKRPKITGKAPLHLTFRLREKMPNLRTRELHREFQNAARGAQEFGVRVNHYCLLSNHLHLIAESDSNKALAAGMRSFCGRLSRGIRKYLSRAAKGSVFVGRYHLHVLKTPSEVRNALNYIYVNFARHSKLIEHIDHFTSAPYFADIQRLLRANPLIKFQMQDWKPKPLPSYIYAPKSWLGREGWRRSAEVNPQLVQPKLAR